MRTHPRLLLAMVLVGLSAATGGCGDDTTSSPVCTGTGCTCADSSCTCAAGTDCNTECGDSDCFLNCTTAAKCNGNTSGALTLECVDTSECKGNGGDNSHITCSASANCDLKAGDNSTATCSDASECKINLGNGSTVTCADTAHCDIKCDADCVVTCAATAACSLMAASSVGPPADVSRHHPSRFGHNRALVGRRRRRVLRCRKLTVSPSEMARLRGLAEARRKPGVGHPGSIRCPFQF
jgi:hypothetical protein